MRFPACFTTCCTIVALPLAWLVACGSETTDDGPCEVNSLRSCITNDGRRGTIICQDAGVWEEECSLEPRNTGGTGGTGDTGGGH